MPRTVSPGRVRSRLERKKRSVRKGSPAKEFNPSREVRLVPERGPDGETWISFVIAPSAIQKLAKAAGVTETDMRAGPILGFHDVPIARREIPSGTFLAHTD